jgi:hypothetical protein
MKAIEHSEFGPVDPETLSALRNESMRRLWENVLPLACKEAGYTPDWATRAPMWSHPDDFDHDKSIVVCGINPGYEPDKQDAVCSLPSGMRDEMKYLDICDHNQKTRSIKHRYFGAYLKLISEQCDVSIDRIRFYDLLPMRESSMSSLRKDYKKGFQKFIHDTAQAHMSWLRCSMPKIVWMHTAWAMQIIGCKDIMRTTRFEGKNYISDPINCYDWRLQSQGTGRFGGMPLLLFKGDQLCGTRSASIPTRNRILRDFKNCIKDLGLIDHPA